MENPQESPKTGAESKENSKKVLVEYLLAGPRGFAEGLKEISDATLGKLIDGIIELAEKLKRAKPNK